MEGTMDFLDTEDFDGSEMNEKIAAAGAILEKIAAEEGVDLNELSDAEVGELVKEVIEAKAEEASSEDSEEEDEMKAASDVTYADVAAELAKVAAHNGIDMSKVSREEYTQAFDEIAEQLTNPELQAQKLAYQEKVAEAEESGRIMARAFADELGLTKEAYSPAYMKGGGGAAAKALKDRIKGAVTGASGKVKDTAKAVSKAVGDSAETAGRTIPGAPGWALGHTKNKYTKATGQKLFNASQKMTRGQAQALAGGVGTLGVAGTGYAGKKGYDKIKKSSDEDFENAALEVAQEYVNKLASEEAVYERAAEILIENGYEI